MKRGAIVVPLFTLFGTEGLRLRLDDCQPRLLLTNAEKADMARAMPGVETVIADNVLRDEIAGYPAHYETATRADDLAVFQYTSGTTRELPEAVRHTHRAIVVLMIAALYGTGSAPATRSSARPRRPGAMACGTARCRRSRSASPRRLCRQVRSGAAHAGAAGFTASPTSRPRRRTTG